MSHPEKDEEPPAESYNSDVAKTKPKPVSFYLSFLSLLLMVLIVSLDSTTLAVAIPVLARELGGTTLEAFWANISFMLAVVIFQPLYLATSEELGRKVPLYTALFLFFAGSLVFALAPNMAIVILGRTIQGLGGSGLDVLTEVITADMTTLKERPLYLGILAIPMAAGCILGPPVGALLSHGLSPVAVSYFRKYLWNIWLGWVFLAVGAGLLYLIGEDASMAFRAGMPVVVGVGMGVLFTVLIIPVQASVSNVDDMGLAVGLLVFFRLLGGLIGLALGSTIFSSVFAKSAETLGKLPSSLSHLGGGSDAIGFIPELREIQSDIPPEILARVLAAYSDSFHAIWLLLAGLASLGFFFSFFTKEVSMESEEMGRQRFEPSP
ncbi:hypothetical protein FQN49_005667 [Arthroderma sp. PD_2]|nr:hypothetical protein FQN49_005667 [Arthroderma sp. PD_2]